MFTQTTPPAILLACLIACILGCGRQGNPPAMEKQEFAIEGMSCEGCVGTITTALKAMPGVTSVEVSLKDKKATVVADSSQVSSQAIEDTVTKAGYKARLITGAGE
jgi:copper chaperone CopZ